MRFAALVMLAGCSAHRVCAPIDAEGIASFHADHIYSNTANDSSVRDLSRSVFVCIECGRATFATDGGENPPWLNGQVLDSVGR